MLKTKLGSLRSREGIGKPTGGTGLSGDALCRLPLPLGAAALPGAVRGGAGGGRRGALGAGPSPGRGREEEGGAGSRILDPPRPR